jgi:fumarate hydratase class II
MGEATRIEKDSMGEMTVPANAYWGAQTQRAVENFPISGYRFGRGGSSGRWASSRKPPRRPTTSSASLDAERMTLIVKAADEVIAGKLDGHFVVDVFQTGSGTSTNMNTNEVISQPRDRAVRGRDRLAKIRCTPTTTSTWGSRPTT